MKRWALFDGTASWPQKAWLCNLCVSLERKQVTAEEVTGAGMQEEVAEVFWVF